MLKTSMKLLPLLVLGAVSGTASAAGFQLLEQNASGMGNAYAGSAASAENASVQYFNAAALTELAGKQISTGVNYIELDSKFHNRASVAPAGWAANAVMDGAQGGDAAFVPNFYFSMPLTKDLYLGVGANAPFGMRTDWPKEWVGQGFGTMTDVKAMNFNLNLAYRLNDQLSVGGGVNYQKFDAQIGNQVNIGVGPAAVGSYLVAGNDWSWGYNLGLLYKPSINTQIGVSYRSAVKHQLEGNYSISGAPGVVAAIVGAGGFKAANGAAKVNIKLPDTWVFSVAHQLNNQWELLGDVSRTGWSSIPELRIVSANGSPDQVSDYRWRDTWRVAGGANYQINDAWKLRLGLAFDQSPVREGLRTPRLPDQDRIWYSIGAQYKINAKNKLDVGYSYVKAKTADANEVGSAAKGTINGEYKSFVQMIGVQYSVSF